MDRTNWKFGKTHINVLTVGIVVGKFAIPITWGTLPQRTKRGNSPSKHRILIMKKVLEILDSQDIEKGRSSHLYVVSNKILPKEALKAYQTGWAIEVLFGHLKNKGFGLESPNLRDRRKIDKLLAVVSLAFLFTPGWSNCQTET